MKNKAIVLTVLVLIMSSFVGVSFAQDDDTSSPNTATRGRDFLRGVFITVTEATGLTGEELRTELQSGATLSEIIEANDGDVDAVIADIEAQVSEQLETLFNTQFELSDRGDGVRDRIRNGIIGEIATAVTEITGLDRAEIVQALRDGSTVTELIEANDGDVDELIANVISSVTNEINERVDNGQITQARADTLLENLEETVTSWLNGDYERPNRGRGNRSNNN